MDEDINNLNNTITKKFATTDEVIIIPSNYRDFDAIAASIALYILSLRANKMPSIFIEDPDNLHNSSKILYSIIKRRGFHTTSTLPPANNFLIILLGKDLSKVPLDKTYLSKKSALKQVISLTYEEPTTSETYLNNNQTFVFSNYVSLCEIITKLLHQSKIRFDKELATYLYTGIYLASNRFSKKGKANETIKLASYLIDTGADIDSTNAFLIEEDSQNQKIKNLVLNNIKVLSYSIACVTGEEHKKYTEEELKEATEMCFRYKVDAAFAIGHTSEKEVAIQARSNGHIDLTKILDEFPTTGDAYEATSHIKATTPTAIEKKLYQKIRPNYYGD